MKFLELMKKKGLVAAHRGARSIAPENTLSALKKSIGKCDFIEIDVQLSKDRTVIVMHDNTLQRTTNIAEIDSFRDKKPYRVCDFMFEELCMLDYGSWFYKYKNHKEPLLTLKRALEFIKENSLFINIEIKDGSIVVGRYPRGDAFQGVNRVRCVNLERLPESVAIRIGKTKIPVRG